MYQQLHRAGGTDCQQEQQQPLPDYRYQSRRNSRSEVAHLAHTPPAARATEHSGRYQTAGTSPPSASVGPQHDLQDTILIPVRGRHHPRHPRVILYCNSIRITTILIGNQTPVLLQGLDEVPFSCRIEPYLHISGDTFPRQQEMHSNVLPRSIREHRNSLQSVPSNRRPLRGIRRGPRQGIPEFPVSYTHLTLPTSDL